MGGRVTRTEFEWVYTQQPHVARRKIILEKYPEIKKLMGPDPSLKYIAIALVLFQIISCYFISQLSWSWIFVLAYCLGGTINHILFLAVHEISHNIAFGSSYPITNRLFGIFANLPIGVPMSMSFKKYHIQHHRYLSVDNMDTDLPSKIEALFFRNIPLKILWLFYQTIFYTLRPIFIVPLPVSVLEIFNGIVQIVFDLLIFYFFGIEAVVYLIGGTLLSMTIHPMSAHMVAEHFMFEEGYETYSYYGIMNMFTFNVGYHVEHHDFPYIAGSKLPEVKRIAAEFYDPLPHHTSWLKVFWDFVMHENQGPIYRLKRDYEETFGKEKQNNPFLTIDTPVIYPMNKDLPMGRNEQGRDIDWAKKRQEGCHGNGEGSESDSGYSDIEKQKSD